MDKATLSDLLTEQEFTSLCKEIYSIPVDSEHERNTKIEIENIGSVHVTLPKYIENMIHTHVLEAAIRKLKSTEICELPLLFFYAMSQVCFLENKKLDKAFFVGHVEYALRILQKRAEAKELCIF